MLSSDKIVKARQVTFSLPVSFSAKQSISPSFKRLPLNNQKKKHPFYQEKKMLKNSKTRLSKFSLVSYHFIPLHVHTSSNLSIKIHKFACFFKCLISMPPIVKSILIKCMTFIKLEKMQMYYFFSFFTLISCKVLIFLG